MVAPYVCDVSLFLHNALKEGKNILLEGQLGSLKDPDHVECTKRETQTHEIYFLINHNREEVRISLPKPLTHVWSGEEYAGEHILEAGDVWILAGKKE